MTIELTYRPIEHWPGDLTKDRKPTPFRSKFNDTLALLSSEIEHLGAHSVVLQLALEDAEIRRDGTPRANSHPRHPGVIVAFETKKHGPMQFATDVFDGYWSGQTGWHANLRAIALGLQALRAVDRYGITRRGEQYTGWQALPPGISMPPARMSVEDAAQFLIDHGEWGGEKATVPDLLAGGPEAIVAYYREAAKRLHPDVGGDTERFKRLQDAKQVLDSFGGQR